MRQFNLEKALAGAALICRGGYQVRGFAVDPLPSPPDPAIGAPAHEYTFEAKGGGCWWRFYCTAEGEVHPRPECEDMDLFMMEIQ